MTEEKRKQTPAPGDMTAKEFADIVEASGLGVKKFAEALGVSRQSIWDWKKGHRRIDKRTAVAIRTLVKRS